MTSKYVKEQRKKVVRKLKGGQAFLEASAIAQVVAHVEGRFKQYVEKENNINNNFTKTTKRKLPMTLITLFLGKLTTGLELFTVLLDWLGSVTVILLFLAGFALSS